nr:Orf1 [uncultured bacterium]
MLGQMRARTSLASFKVTGLKPWFLPRFQTTRFGQVVVSERQFLQSEIRLFLVSLLRRKALVFLRKALA